MPSAHLQKLSRSTRVQHDAVLLELTHNLLPALGSTNPVRKSVRHSLIIPIRAHERPGRIEHEISLVIVFALEL